MRGGERWGADAARATSDRVQGTHRWRASRHSPRAMSQGQRVAHQGPRAAVRTLGDVDTGPLLHPFYGAGFLSWRWLRWLVEQLATLAQGACLAPVREAVYLHPAAKYRKL